MIETPNKIQYNACLVGLGKIGSGVGEYAQSWNSHLSALKQCNFVKDIALVDPFIDLTPFLEGAVNQLDETNIDDQSPWLLVDAGPMDGRAERILHYAQKLNPEVILAEKPFLQTPVCFEPEFPRDRIYIHYPRRRFPSTTLLQGFLKDGFLRCDMYFNNGIFNALSHFVDLIMEVIPDFDWYQPITKTDTGYQIGNIHIHHLNDKIPPVFEFKFYSHAGLLNYKNFGRVIMINDMNYHFEEELAHRFRYIYDDMLSIKQLPKLDTDYEVNKVLKIIEGLND